MKLAVTKMVNAENDDNIVRLLRSKNQDDVNLGMEYLDKQYGHKMNAIVCSWSRSLDHHTREDIFQIVRLKTIATLRNGYRHDGKLWRYLAKVVKWKTIDIVRQEWKRTSLIRPIGDLPQDDKPPLERPIRTRDRPDLIVQLSGQVEIVRVALTKLTNSHQEIIKLRYSRNLSYKEIAEELKHSNWSRRCATFSSVRKTSKNGTCCRNRFLLWSKIMPRLNWNAN